MKPRPQVLRAGSGVVKRQVEVSIFVHVRITLLKENAPSHACSTREIARRRKALAYTTEKVLPFPYMCVSQLSQGHAVLLVLFTKGNYEASDTTRKMGYGPLLDKSNRLQLQVSLT